MCILREFWNYDILSQNPIKQSPHQVQVVEDINISHDRSFLGPMGEFGEPQESENNQLAAINHFPADELRILRCWKLQARNSTQSTSCFGPRTLPGTACFLGWYLRNILSCVIAEMHWILTWNMGYLQKKTGLTLSGEGGGGKHLSYHTFEIPGKKELMGKVAIFLLFLNTEMEGWGLLFEVRYHFIRASREQQEGKHCKRQHGPRVLLPYLE